MAEVKFERTWCDYITPCPFKRKDKSGKPIMVGEYECQNECPFCYGKANPIYSVKSQDSSIGYGKYFEISGSSVKCIADKMRKSTVENCLPMEEWNTKEINAYYRVKDESDLWPICNKFNVTERAIRNVHRHFNEMGLKCEGLQYILALDSEISHIVNNM